MLRWTFLWLARPSQADPLQQSTLRQWASARLHNIRYLSATRWRSWAEVLPRMMACTLAQKSKFMQVVRPAMTAASWALETSDLRSALC